jgi:hypothetical protein
MTEQTIVRWSVLGWAICVVAAGALAIAIENSLLFSLAYLAIAFAACAVIWFKFPQYRPKASTSLIATLLIVISPLFRLEDGAPMNGWIYGLGFSMFAIAFFLPAPK